LIHFYKSFRPKEKETVTPVSDGRTE